MRKIFMVVALVLAVGLVGIAQAATSSIDNLPGGAGIAYFQCGANGDTTLLNVQNVSIAGSVAPNAVNLFRNMGNAKNAAFITPGDYPVVVHVVFYDHNSNEIINFNVPLSPRDNWGAAVTCNGTNLTVTPSLPVVFGGMPYTGGETRTAPFTGSRGYVTFAITAIGPVNTVDPRQQVNLTGTNAYLPDAIFLRTAILNLTSGFALAFNGNMLQGFANMIPNAGTTSTYTAWNSVADAACAAAQFGNVPTTGSFSTDDGNGIRIDTHELFLTDNTTGPLPRIVNDNCLANYAGAMPALGSGNGVYWGRYNRGAGTSSALLTVFPANNGPGNSLPTAFSGRTMNMLIYNDNEDVISDTETVVEAASTAFGTVINTNGDSGEVRIFTPAPMFGYTITTGSNFADAYPLVAEKKALYHTNITWLFDGPLGVGTVSEVVFLGSE